MALVEFVETPKKPVVKASDVKPPMSVSDALETLIGSPDLCSKRWVWEQYDHTVMADTVQVPGGDAAVQVLPALVILLTSPDDQLFLLDGDLELIEGEARNRQRDAQAFRKLLVGSEPFDVVRGVAVCRLGHAIERTLDLVEANQERT